MRYIGFEASKSYAGTGWQEATAFYFGGSTAWGAVSKFCICMKQKGSTNNVSGVRIYDETNNTTIVIKEDISVGTTISQVDLGVISSLPSAPAIFRVDTREVSNGANGEPFLKTLIIQF
jgi:hypothetical protein